MRKELLPGEQVIAMTRQQARSLFFPVLLFVVVPAVGAYICAWLVKGNAQRLAPFITVEWTPWLIGATLVLAGWLLLGYCVRRVLRWRSVRYILTSRRILAKYGMFRRNDWQVSLAAVRNVGIQQNLLQRTLHSGNISLDTGHSGTAVLNDVPLVGKFRDFVQDAMDDLPRGGVVEGEVLGEYVELPWELREGGRDER
ncbi:PH domain-containing protein [Paenarthrobacter ilicis]|uniref:Membrane protein YdbT with pleckstrin-like domain n=1 Tax=Paenarthrobacter ilicis TaxID=43665 RepID=A0ABX0TGE7_9MICC|nr:PH domain-containing protein [Paenarthrobacter ilicis]MBM7792637.1 putative membrane protein YdbT with pleckstrin-like domain [Paenarthrobacter ilicis]NIJ00980.1 putative membrane protein YdbT with pleckstrin-like domain [Paenarthrobacter ilicis]